MSIGKYRFFKEQEELSNFTVDDENGDLFFIPNGKEKLNTSIIEPSDYDDSELVYTHSSNSKIDFSQSRLDQPQYFIDKRIQVRKTPTMGLGCFSIEKIPEKTIIESCPVILVHRDTFLNLNLYNGAVHKLSEYPFNWRADGMVAFALGYGGIYNHSVSPNVVWRPDHNNQSIQFTSIKEIEPGQELFIRYLPLSNLDRLWFYDEDSVKYVKENKVESKKDLGNYFNIRFK